MDIVFFNRSRLEDPGLPAKQLGSLRDEVKKSDFVVISVANSADSYYLVDTEVLSEMQPHAILVNVSRGNVLDEAALIRVLKEGKIAGAGLDVYEHEPVIPDALRELDNVVLLPHLGTSVLDVREAKGMMAVANLVAFFREQRLQT